MMHHTGGLRSYIELLLLSGRTFAERTTREDALHIIARQRGFDDVPAEEDRSAKNEQPHGCLW